MYMTGMLENGEKDIPRALHHLERAICPTPSSIDAMARNALGALYYQAPNIFETDPVRLSGYGGVRRDYALA